MKLIVLVLGLAIGFGGGVWYGVRHPEWAKDFANKEEEMVLKGKIEAMEKSRSALDQIIAHDKAGPAASTPGGVSGFVSSAAGATPTDARVALVERRQTLDQDLSAARKRLADIQQK